MVIIYNDARQKFISLHEKLSGVIYEEEKDSYLRDMSQRHTKINKRLKECIGSNVIASKYRIASSSKSTGSGNKHSIVCSYYIDIDKKHINIHN